METIREFSAVEAAVKRLATARASKREALSEMETALHEWQARPEIAALIAFDVFGEQHPHRAVTVIGRKVFDYADADALAYCQAHLPTALTFNNKLFEKVAEAAGLVFVAIRREPRVRIDSDLTAYLGA